LEKLVYKAYENVKIKCIMKKIVTIESTIIAIQNKPGYCFFSSFSMGNREFAFMTSTFLVISEFTIIPRSKIQSAASIIIETSSPMIILLIKTMIPIRIIISKVETKGKVCFGLELPLFLEPLFLFGMRN
jgi:hypothetical protein